MKLLRVINLIVETGLTYNGKVVSKPTEAKLCMWISRSSLVSRSLLALSVRVLDKSSNGKTAAVQARNVGSTPTLSTIK